MKKGLVWVMILTAVLITVTACARQKPATPTPGEQGAIEDKGEIKQNDGIEEGERQKTPKRVDRINIGWMASGFPSPFTFSTIGPGGFLRNSFLFDTLTWKDEEGVIPWLSHRWEISDDGLVYTFMLRDDVKWHDGEVFNAYDVAFSFDYFKRHPFGWRGDVSMIESVEAVDELTVRFTLNVPYAPFISEVVGIIPIIPEHIWSKVDDPMQFFDDSALIGTGPFILTSFEKEKGNYLFTANENFFKGKPIVQEIAYINVANRALSLKNGEIDAAMLLNYKEAQEFVNLGFAKQQSKPTGSAVRFMFNLDHPQLRERKLRQAIAYALDRATIAEKVLGGNAIVGSAGVIPPDSPWYYENVRQYEFSVRKANSLLDELGYTKDENGMRSGLALNLLFSAEDEVAQLAQMMLKEVGIELTLQKVDRATFVSLMGENKHDIALTGHIGFSGDPDFLRILFSGEASNMLAARGRAFDNESFMRLAKEQARELNEERRRQLVNEMQEILAEELPTLILFHRPFYWLYRQEQFDGWFNTFGGIADGIPLWDNKAAFIDDSQNN